MSENQVQPSAVFTGLPPGRHKLYARATDGQGQKQTRDRVSNYLGGAFPDGALQMQWVQLVFESQTGKPHLGSKK